MEEQSGLAGGLIRTHLVITRSLAQIEEKSRTFSQDGIPAGVSRQGFFDYVRAFVTVLEGHHESEDQLAFPFFAVRLPGTPYEQLAAEHQTMLPILSDMSAAVVEAQAEGMQAAGLAQLGEAAARLAAIWHPHIQKEETHFSPEALARAVDRADEDKLLQEIGAFTQQHSKPEYLVVPFMLYNLPAAERSMLASQLPPVITQQLVPMAWKAQWEPMTPFLLP